jgi:prepilin-type N-terminal cleavage/methylation domain-containing protein
MKRRGESGFSLIEILLVVVIVGVIAAMALPAYQKGMWAAENGSAFSTMRTIASTQVSFYTQHNRFGRLDEINRLLGNGVGTVVGDRLVRGKYVFEMTPVRPDDADLATEYLISATRDVAGDAVYRYELNQSGRITQVYPVGAPQN